MNISKHGSSSLKKVKRISGAATIGIVLFIIILGMAGCSEPEPIEATWITAPVSFDNVSIPLDEINDNKMVHFFIETDSTGKIAFMAYELDKKIYIRSNVCPPCGSIGFALQKDILVCDTCSTTFNAKTGDGIEGACVDFPKESVDYEIVDNNITMTLENMINSYLNTLKPGW